MTHHLSTCMLAPYVTMHLKEKKVWGSHKIRVIFLHSMWQGIQKLKCFENNSVFWSTGVFWKHFSSLIHCHTWCKQASNLHEDKEWITQPFSCTDWKKCEVNEWWHQGEWIKNILMWNVPPHIESLPTFCNNLEMLSFLLQFSAKMVSHQSFTAQILFQSVLEKWLGYSCFVLM